MIKINNKNSNSPVDCFEFFCPQQVSRIEMSTEILVNKKEFIFFFIYLSFTDTEAELDTLSEYAPLHRLVI